MHASVPRQDAFVEQLSAGTVVVDVVDVVVVSNVLVVLLVVVVLVGLTVTLQQILLS